MKFCSHCGKEIENDFSFCSSCGKSLTLDENVQTPQIMPQNPINPKSNPIKKFIRQVGIGKIIVAILIIVGIVFLINIISKPSIIGTWIGDDIANFEWTFTEDGTLIGMTYAGGSKNTPATYTISGNQLEIRYKLLTNWHSTVYKYKINGNKLILIDEMYGQINTFTKK